MERIPARLWVQEAKQHRQAIINLLYPPGKTETCRRHLVRKHPVYNFIHQYYRFTPSSLLLYSPGVGVLLDIENGNRDNNSEDTVTALSKYHDILHPSHQELIPASSMHNASIRYCLSNPNEELLKNDKFQGQILELYRCREMMRNSFKRRPHFSCFGLHEWAMVYSGKPSSGNASEPANKKQEALNFRVSQAVINKTVEDNSLRCTHFDAFRFFHEEAMPMNLITDLKRSTQVQYEQPGCIHHTMDLFRFAYLAYPLVPASLLRECLALALQARTLDLRASPYDVSSFAGCEEPICVETVEGKRAMVREQEKLYFAAMPVRQKLLQAFDDLFQTCTETNFRVSSDSKLAISSSN